MKLKNERLKYGKDIEPNDILLIATHALLKTDGSLIMNGGAAQEIKDLYPCVPGELGISIKEFTKEKHDYFLAFSSCSGKPIWAFQVKRHYRYREDIELLIASTRALYGTAMCKPDHVFHMNYPVNNKHPNYKGAKEILETLPDNVILYR